MTKSFNALNPCYEFGGPLGVVFVSLAAPITTYALFFTCSEMSEGCPPSLGNLLGNFIFAVTDLGRWKSLWDIKAFFAYYG